MTDEFEIFDRIASKNGMKTIGEKARRKKMLEEKNKIDNVREQQREIQLEKKIAKQEKIIIENEEKAIELSQTSLQISRSSLWLTIASFSISLIAVIFTIAIYFLEKR